MMYSNVEIYRAGTRGALLKTRFREASVLAEPLGEATECSALVIQAQKHTALCAEIKCAEHTGLTPSLEQGTASKLGSQGRRQTAGMKLFPVPSSCSAW